MTVKLSVAAYREQFARNKPCTVCGRPLFMEETLSRIASGICAVCVTNGTSRWAWLNWLGRPVGWSLRG